MEVPDKVGRALARPRKCHVRKGVEIYFFVTWCLRGKRKDEEEFRKNG